MVYMYMHHIVKLSSDETVTMKALEHPQYVCYSVLCTVYCVHCTWDDQLNGVSGDQRQFMTPQWLPLLLRYQLEERS